MIEFPRLTRSAWRFWAGGRGLSVRTGQYFAESLLVGLVTGFVVVGFRHLIQLGDRLLFNGLGRHGLLSRLPRGEATGGATTLAEALADPHRWLFVALPALGAVLGYLLIRRFARLEHARGTDSAIRAYHHGDGFITSTVVPVKSVASVLTVASGGSAGYEGPVTLIGAACGCCVGRVLRLSVRARRILMAAGLAAGIAALFQAPLAGAIFGFEIFYSSSDFEYETVLPSFIASAVSYTVFASFFGWGPLFAMPACAYENGLRLLPYFLLAIVITFGARFYIRCFRHVERSFGRLRAPGWAKVALGGLLTGAIGFFVPDVLGTGYPVIQASFLAGTDGAFANVGPLTVAAFVCFFFMKAIATACTVGSGASGGVFAPAIVCGGSLGAAVGLAFAAWFPAAFGIRPAAFALVGMAGFIAGTVRIPLTAIVIVAEISGNHALLLPAMWVCGIAFWLNNGWSLYRSQPHSRESSPLHGGRWTSPRPLSPLP